MARKRRVMRNSEIAALRVVVEFADEFHHAKLKEFLKSAPERKTGDEHD